MDTQTPTPLGEISDGYHTFNELYEHRHMLLLALASTLDGNNLFSKRDVWMSKQHSNGAIMEGWFIVGIELPFGDITYHVPERLWNDFADAGIRVLDIAPKWDGHTSQDVINRLKDYATK